MSLEFREFITKENVEEFVLSYASEFTEKEDYFYVKFYNQYMGPSPEFQVTDFTFKGINSYHSFDLSDKWRTHMLRTINPSLRKEYIKKFNEHLDNSKLSDANADLD